MRPRPRLLPVLLALLVLMAAVAACSGAAAPAPLPEPATLAGYYAQRLDWRPCDGGFQCAELVVPFDYARPAGPRFTLPVIKLRAADPAERIGALVVNPGGPGASGVQYALGARAELPATVLARFDIVGFDPRGVGGSQPALNCLTGLQLDTYLATDDEPAGPAQLTRLIAESKRLRGHDRERVPDQPDRPAQRDDRPAVAVYRDGLKGNKSETPREEFSSLAPIRSSRRCGRPARPPFHCHRQHWSRRSRVPVLPVALRQQSQRLRRLALPGQDYRPAVGANPPQRVPVVGVLVGQHGDPRILADVSQPLQVGPGLRLLVDGRVDRISFDREGDHHHMRPPLNVCGPQPRHGHRGEPGPRLAFGKPHAEDITVTGAAGRARRDPASDRLVGSPRPGGPPP